TLTATPGSGQVVLFWSGIADTGSGLATTNPYKLVYSVGTSSPTCASGTQLLLGTATSFTHTGLTNGTTYSYRLCATDNAGNASTGATASTTPQLPAPFSPTLVGFVPGVGDARAVAVAGGRAYLASDPFGLSVAKVTTPTAPVVIGASDVPFFGHSIAVSGTRAVVGGRTQAGLAHLWVLDLSVPTAPTVLGELATTAPVTTSGTGYMGSTNGTIHVVHATNPAGPLRIGGATTALSGPGTHVAVEGSVAVVLSTNTSDYLDVLNISNPALPVRTASVTLGPPGTGKGVTLVAGLAYIAADAVGGLKIYDVGTPTPVGQGSVNDDFAPRAIAVSSGRAAVAGKYVPTLTVRLQVLTVAN